MILDPCQSSVEKFAGVFNKVFTTQGHCQKLCELEFTDLWKKQRFSSIPQFRPRSAVASHRIFLLQWCKIVRNKRICVQTLAQRFFSENGSFWFVRNACLERCHRVKSVCSFVLQGTLKISQQSARHDLEDLTTGETVLKIQELRATDAGTYRCVASNTAGKASCSVELVLAGKGKQGAGVRRFKSALVFVTS